MKRTKVDIFKLLFYKNIKIVLKCCGKTKSFRRLVTAPSSGLYPDNRLTSRCVATPTMATVPTGPFHQTSQEWRQNT